MLALTGTVLAGCGNSTSGEGSDKGSKLAAIKSRGHLNAGVKKDVPGYGYYDTAKGRFEGMEVDLCYQIAAAVFGVSYKDARAQELVEFTDVTPKTRGPLMRQRPTRCGRGDLHHHRRAQEELGFLDAVSHRLRGAHGQEAFGLYLD